MKKYSVKNKDGKYLTMIGAGNWSLVASKDMRYTFDTEKQAEMAVKMAKGQKDTIKDEDLEVVAEGMRYVKTFEDYTVSEGFRYHMENGLDITNSVYRIGSEAYKQLFEETKKYWDEGNVILSDKAAWMTANLEVGKDAVDSDGRKVELDTPKRGGDKKFYVYHNSGKKDDDGNIIAARIEWGDVSGLSIKNDDPKAAASYWARQQCDLKKSMNPLTAKFWSCYGPSLFSKQLGLSSDMPW